MVLNVRGFRYLLIPLVFLLFSTSKANDLDDDIRIDVPADGRVQVDNKFGDVTAEVWNNQYVSVSTVVSNAAPSVALKRSPILIDNRGTYLSISAVRVPISSTATIDLRIKIPPKANLEVSTTSGRIIIRGLSSSALLKSGSGDIEASIDEPLNVNLTARATRGLITSNFPSKPSAEDHLWQARLGMGSPRRTLDAQTESGRISLAPMNNVQVVTETQANR